jgi:ribosomal protein S18 acetylase RimI-like enzyme
LSKFAEYVPGPPAGPPPLAAADGLVIRAAAPPDLAILAAIAAEREGEPVALWEERFARFHGSPGDRALLVAALEGQPIGYGKTGHFTPEAGSPANVAPAGWYLSGLIVAPEFRRRGVGLALTRARLAWVAERHPRAYYFANARNQVTIDLHRQLGFVEITRDFVFPHVEFEGGIGILFACDLRGPSRR